MPYDTPTEVFKKNHNPKEIQRILNERYTEWWVLDRIIDSGGSFIYYFKNIYVEQTMQNDVRNNDVVEAVAIESVLSPY